MNSVTTSLPVRYMHFVPADMPFVAGCRRILRAFDAIMAQAMHGLDHEVERQKSDRVQLGLGGGSCFVLVFI